MTDLDDAVAALVEPVVYHHEGGVNGKHITTLDARLARLNLAIRSSMGSGGRSGGSDPAAMNTLDSDALFKSMMINTAIVDWCVVAHVPRGPDPAVNLRTWAASVPEGEERPNQLRRMREWVAMIDDLLDKEKEIEVTAPCVHCNADTWVDSAGETHPNPVRIYYRVEAPLDTARAICHACSETWAGIMAIRALRWELSSETPEKVFAFD